MKFLSPLLFCFVMVLFIQKVEAEKIPQSFIDSIASQSDYFPLQVDFVNENGNNSAERIKKASLALLYGRLTYVAEFPTAATTVSINSRCKADSQNYFASYLAREDWALRMHQSTGKLSEDLQTDGGRTSSRSYGLFDKCINTPGPKTSKGSTSFNGKYCSIFFNAQTVTPEELDSKTIRTDDQRHQRDSWISTGQLFQWFNQGRKLLEPKVNKTSYGVQHFSGVDFCLPSSCSAEDIQRAVAEFVGQETIYSDVDEFHKIQYYSIVTYAGDDWCYTRESVDAMPIFDAVDFFFMLTLSILALFTLIATAHEGWALLYETGESQDSLAVRYLYCFSIISNGKKLLSTETQPGNITCLNGIRALSATWVVLFHSFFILTVYRNTVNYDQLMNEEFLRWAMQVPLNATVSVDTFFLMSGLLVAYTMLRELEHYKGRFNFAIFYIHRYLRLTPVYGMILGFIATLLVYISYGPNWQLVHYMREGCRWNWWSHFLYINNYVAASSMGCMGESWYLAADMQMFIVSPLLIWPLWRWKGIGSLWILLNIAIFTGGIIIIYIVWDLPATVFFTRPIESQNENFSNDYMRQMWSRFPCYMVGILLGWILHRTKDMTIFINKYLVAFIWTLASAIGLAIVYGLIPYLNEDKVPEMNSFVRVSYGSLNRLVWSVVVGWVIFACVHGYGGPVNRFLSGQVFIPLSRLTYIIYLVHVNYLLVWSAHLRKPIYYTDMDHAHFFFGVVFCVTLLAFVISLTVETPFLSLQKLIFSSFRRKPEGAGAIEEVEMTTNERVA